MIPHGEHVNYGSKNPGANCCWGGFCCGWLPKDTKISRLDSIVFSIISMFHTLLAFVKWSRTLLTKTYCYIFTCVDIFGSYSAISISPALQGWQAEGIGRGFFTVHTQESPLGSYCMGSIGSCSLHAVATPYAQTGQGQEGRHRWLWMEIAVTWLSFASSYFFEQTRLISNFPAGLAPKKSDPPQLYPQ